MATENKPIDKAFLESMVSGKYFFTALDGMIGTTVGKEGAEGEVAAHKVLGNITVCVLVLHNGYTVEGINHGAAFVDNHDKELGKKYAYEEALAKLWPLVGCIIKERVYSEGM